MSMASSFICKYCCLTALVIVITYVSGIVASTNTPATTSTTFPDADEYAHVAYLNGAAARTVEFRWSIGNSANYGVRRYNKNSSMNNHVLVAQLSVPTRGYISWGLSPNGGMSGANMLVMWVDDDADGVAHVQDRYATDFVEPSIIAEEKSSVVSYSGSQNATHTVVQFVRWIDVGCRNEHGITIMSNSMHVVYAFGDADLDSSGHIRYHGPSNRGSQTLYLLDDTSGNFEREKASARRNGIAYDFTARNFLVPEQETTYQCTYHQLPEINSDLQMIGLEAIVDPKNTDLVHHFVVHLCENDAFNNSSAPTVPSFTCYDTPLRQQEERTFKCLNNYFWAWGVGGTGTYMPPNVGYRFTPRDSRRYFLLETHYNNPGLKADRVDNSGFRLILTNKIRPQETSLLMVGTAHDASVVIPGNTPAFTIPGVCHASCTEKYLPPTGTRMFSTFLHSHVLGQSMALRHFRDVTELPPVLVDETYDFNYQQYRPTNSTLMPGDSLVLECNYSSAGRVRRSQTTIGGNGITQEMCVAFLFVTPPVALEACSNAVNKTLLFGLLADNKAVDFAMLTPTKNMPSQTESMALKNNLLKQLSDIEWDSSKLTLVKTLQDFYLNSQQSMVCVAGHDYAQDNGFPQPTKTWQTYKPSVAESTPCNVDLL